MSELTCLPPSALLLTAQGASGVGRSSRTTPSIVAMKSRVAGPRPCVSCWPFGDRSAVSVMRLSPFVLGRQRNLRVAAHGLAAIVARNQLEIDMRHGQAGDARL